MALLGADGLMAKQQHRASGVSKKTGSLDGGKSLASNLEVKLCGIYRLA